MVWQFYEEPAKVAFARYFSIGDKNLIEIRTKNSLVSSVFDGFLIAVIF